MTLGLRTGLGVSSGVARCAAVAIGVASVAWAIAVYPQALTGLTLDTFGQELAGGDAFKTDALEALRPRLDALKVSPDPRPYSLRDAAVVEVRLAELQIADGKDVGGNPQFARAEQAVRAALKVRPTDSFLWFALFWLKKTRDGFQTETLPLLQQSYALGPFEGWVAVRRNGIAVSLLPLLPKDLQARVIKEYRDLVASNFIGDAAVILAGPGWAQHDALLAGTADVPLDLRVRLADALYDQNLDVIVPGVERLGQRRPWR